MNNLANKHKKKIRKTNKQYPLMEYFLEEQIFNVSKYNQKAMDILFAHIPKKDLQKVINKLADEQIKGVNKYVIWYLYGRFRTIWL